MRLIFIGFLIAAMPALAQEADTPPVEESVGFSFYIVQGPSLAVIEEVMVAKGGGAGADVWQVSASETCAVALSATVALPKLIGKRNLSQSDVEIWETMLDALEAYQQRHVAIGREAAAAVRAASCGAETETEPAQTLDALLEPFREKSRQLDVET
ncbi:MAG: DUF922 domain-containing protein [Pseudomonadota bacterium]